MKQTTWLEELDVNTHIVMPKKSSRYPCFRPQDSVSVTSSLSPSHTLASEACEETEARESQRTKSRFSSSSSSSSSVQHRDKRAFFWNTALVRLRNSFRSGNKISSDSSQPPRQKNSSSLSAQENAACVRLSTTTSVEEDFVWHQIFGWQSDIIYAVHSSVKYKVSNGDKSRLWPWGPIRDQYSGHVICLDQTGAELSW